MYKACIFDLDGTLLNTLQDLTNACNFALLEMGFPLKTKEEIRSMIGNGKTKLMERILPKGYQYLHDNARLYYDSYYTINCMKETTPYAGIRETLSFLKEHGVKLAVFSNKSDSIVQPMIEHYFPGIFDVVLGGDTGIPLKPDPEGLNRIISGLNISSNDILFIGDSDVDVKTGKNGHTHSCGVLWGYRSEENIRKENPDYIIHKPEELERIVYAE